MTGLVNMRTFLAAAACMAAGWVVGCSSGRAPGLIGVDVSSRSDGDSLRSEAQRSRQVSLDRRTYHHYINGLMFEGLGDWENASGSYEKALASFPESREIAFSYARSLYQLRKPHDAINVLQQITLDDPRHLRFAARCYHDMGMPDSVRVVYVRLARIDSLDSRTFSFLAGMYRQRRDIDSTVWAYRNLIRIRPDNIGYLNELADLLAQQNKFPDARQILHRSLEVEFGPTNIRAIHALGELYLMDSLFDSAAFTFQRGLRVEPDNLMLHQQLAMAYIRMDSLQAALTPAHRIVELSPRDQDAVRRLGILYYSLDSLDVADSVLSSLVAGGDRNATNHFYLGRIAALKDNWYRARDEFIRRTEMADTLSDSWLDLALAYRRLEQRDNEIETYRRGLGHMRDERDAVNLYFALGAAYEQDGQITEAVATFEELIAHNPDHAQSLNYLGYMLADRGEKLQYARELIERALQISPDNAAYLDSYGWVMYRLKRYQEAVAFLSRAVELGTDAVIFDHLGDAYDALGLRHKGMIWWERALIADPENETIKRKLGR